MPGELARDSGWSAEEEIIRVMKSILDRLQQEITTRFTRLRDLDSKFGFLLDIENLLKSEDLNTLCIHCMDLGNFYDTDVDGGGLYTDICDCKMLLKTRRDLLLHSPLQLISFMCLMVKMSSQTCELLFRFCLQLLYQSAVVNVPSAN
jgi:hypothetical protein